MSGKRIITQHFSVPIKNLQFHFGGVSCKRLIKELNKAIAITIINYDIREEFDAVKEYFANALGTQHIDVAVRLELQDDAVRKIEAQSEQIAAINQNLIETVRFQFVKEAVKKKVKIETEQNVVTMEEFFTAFSDRKVSAAFYDDEKQLAEDLLEIGETKHYNHLRLLAARHAHHVMRLRFVLKPFSFLFLLEGTDHYHIVWETLDTEEATYVWPVEKDIHQLKLALKKVEDILQLVKVQGKAAYLSSPDKRYRRIFHHYKEGTKGFVKWKGELESMLI
jgi:hypothetical protein